MTMSRLLGEPGGTRGDPFAQPRAAREQSLLVHSLSVFREVFEQVHVSRKIATVVEVGVESGDVTGMYAELGAEAVYAVEPAPSAALRARFDGEPNLHLVEEASPAALAALPVADLYVVDGDHNYAVVRAELEWILVHAPDAVVVLHDVLWPCGRRDFYYQPTPLGPEERHEDSADGPTVWHDDLTPAGFVGVGAFTVAKQAGGERNGVLTAVEDAVAAAPAPWTLRIVPAVFGLGVLVRSDGPDVDDLLRRLQPFTGSSLLATLENNRIALYTRVLEMQHEAVVHAAGADAMSEEIAVKTGYIAELEQEVARLRGNLDVALAPAPEPPPRSSAHLAQAALRRLRRTVRRR
jgi:hypothetical protein